MLHGIRCLWLSFFASVLLCSCSSYTQQHNSVDSAAKAWGAHGADVNSRDAGGVTPLIQAARGVYDETPAQRQQRVQLIKTLIALGADVNAKTDHNRTALHEAVSDIHLDSDFEIVRYLVESGADVTVQDNDGHTVLHSIKQDNLALAKYLYQQGADPTQRSSAGDQPICYAIANNQQQLLIFYFANTNFVTARCQHTQNIFTYAQQHASQKTQDFMLHSAKIVLKEYYKYLKSEQNKAQ